MRGSSDTADCCSFSVFRSPLERLATENGQLATVNAKLKK